jgi:hypothetical protein
VKDRGAFIVIALFFLSCALAHSATRHGGRADNHRQPTPERLWKAFPLQQQTTPRPPQQQPTTQPLRQQPAVQPPPARSQRRDRGSQAPWLWILVGAGVGLGATAVLVASSLSKSHRRGDRQRAASRRVTHLLVGYRLEFISLAAAVASGLVIGWLDGGLG